MDRRFQEVNHESQRTRFKHYLMSPYKNSRSIVSLQQIGNTHGGKTKTGPGLHPKAQISILPPGKYQRPARFREGVDFWTPSPCLNVSLSSVCASFGVGNGLFDLPVQV